MESPETKLNNKKEEIVSAETKRAVLAYLQKNGCTHANLAAIAETHGESSQVIIDNITSSAENAESTANKVCESDSLNNINKWLEVLKSAGIPQQCDYEAAAIVNGIIRNEKHPKPEEVGGIDVREVYGFLEKGLLGQPQKKLSAASEAFLCNEMKLLIDEANNEKSDDLARLMGKSLMERKEYNYEAEPHKCSLDPLFLDE